MFLLIFVSNLLKMAETEGHEEVMRRKRPELVEKILCDEYLWDHLLMHRVVDLRVKENIQVCRDIPNTFPSISLNSFQLTAQPHKDRAD